MEIGQPKRVREVEPLEAPVTDVIPDPQPAPVEVPGPVGEPAPAGRGGSDDHQVADARR
jgi:hypothetical protein